MANKKVPENETPEERFRRVANRRTKSVIKNIRLLGNMFPQPSYAISQEDAQKVLDAVSNAYEYLQAQATSRIEGKTKEEIEDVF